MSKCRNLLASTALLTLGAVPALAEPLGIGRAALPEEVAAWDVAIMPDGRGLPQGGGNVLDGEDLWIEQCAVCHGDFAEGAGNWPQIVGGLGTLMDDRPVKTTDSYWPHLSTVWDYVNRSMPFGAAQTLTGDEVYAITAYILYSGGLVDDDFELTHENFTSITLPNADGFFVDDRDDVELPLFTQEPCMSDCRAPVSISARATDIDVTPEFPIIRFTYSDGSAPAPAPTDTVEEASAEPEAAPAEEAVQMASLDPALVAAGEAAWRQCRTCHQLGDGARNGTGPQLNGVVGQAAGHADGFRYSPALIEASEGGLVWTEETLDAFLENPAGLIPRNRMSFRGVRSEDERAALIAYLMSYSN
ncbi:sulfur dehydrogenase subunit SoxD [Roseinatronobacter thiooxidans]|uniref:Sulfur dehydrogenase subunit SoxD n=1 Tax=Roseinatronobacter thiooxidans TaxID=121821 RepID=A0A2W7PYL9_9RHOB|nr:c-type cytochrome [Roseinatronobacter thiooxidans]PZX38950.1 sulfur dehydrogenase subunit SoxD [Roseinatronobacter thiooxidans]